MQVTCTKKGYSTDQIQCVFYYTSNKAFDNGNSLQTYLINVLSAGHAVASGQKMHFNRFDIM